MKNRLLVIILAFSLPILSFAQGGTFKAGVIGGVNLAQLDGDILAGYNKLGLHAGVTVGVQVSDLFRTNLEILYVQKGSRSSKDEQGIAGGALTRYSFDYVEVPLMLNYVDGGFMLNAGFSYSRLVRVREMLVADVDLTTIEADFVNTNSFSLLAGIGYFITENIGIEVRYAYDPFTVINYKDSPGYDNAFISKSLTFRALYMF
jgi:hypothetical protein